MQIDFLTTLINVAIMVALAVPGFILKKKSMLPDSAVRVLVMVLMYACQPFLSITSFLEKDYESSLLLNMGLAFVVSFFLHIAMFYVAKLVFSLAKPRTNASDEERIALERTRKACNVCSFMGNIGYMGIPVMRALFPQYPEMLMYTAVVIVAFNITSWTFGVYTITGNKKDMSLRRAFLNPAVAPLVVAIPLFLLKRYIPTSVIEPISNGMSYLADMTLPLAMLVAGIRLADMSVRELFCDPKAYVVCALKLVVSPLMTLGIMLLVRLAMPSLPASLIIALYIAMAMPCAAMSLNFAELYDGDAKLALKAVLLSTALCTITIPLLMLLCFAV